jgi:hypothetical protein
MKDYEDMQYFPTQEKLVEVLCQKTQNTSPLFFRILASYYFTKIASMMRVNIDTHDRGVIPVNMYAVNLAISGQGKGHSTNIIEEEVINQFKERFLNETFPTISMTQLAVIANKRAIRKSSDPDMELERTQKEFEDMGEMAFSFDSGTTAAVKQMRAKLLYSAAGSMNMEIDEIGSNLLSNTDVLTSYLELFDVGKIKQKLTKNTQENTRSAEVDGRTPANMMLFGTPFKLMDGGKTELEFLTFLETGYARRCFFGYQLGSTKAKHLTAEQRYDMLTDSGSNQFIEDLSDRFYTLADPAHFNKSLDITKEVTLELIEYQMHCEELADDLPDHQEMQKAEITHRYFKALKLAGTYAFIDGSPEIKEEHLYAAIKLAEDSGNAFQEMLQQDKNYVKLAKYISSINREVTHVDLMEDLPCYKGGESYRRELLTLATAWGYKNNIILKRNTTDGIEFLSGESMQEVDLSQIRVSYSTDLAKGYIPKNVPFNKLHILTQKKDHHWASHHFLGDHRAEENAIPGFDMIVLDVDEGCDIKTAQLLLKDYTYHIYTTKRHTPQANRFRIILPMSHHIKLDEKEFKEFMRNVYEWLPIKVDDKTGQRARKWESFSGQFFYNQGELIDSLMFIPKTSKCEQSKKIVTDLSNLTNIERWFMGQTSEGNRSNNLVRYALMLVDSGMDQQSVQNNVLQLNSKLDKPLDETEILGTIMQTATKAIVKRDNPNP